MQCFSLRYNSLEQFRSQRHNVGNKLGSRSWSNGMGHRGGVDGCNSGVWGGVWVSAKSGWGVSIRVSRSGVSILVVMGGCQMRSSMVVDKGWVGFSFSFGFTFNNMMIGGGVDGCNSGMGCGVWGGVDGCYSGMGGCVRVSSIRGHIGVSRVKWVGWGSIGNNLLSIYIGLGNGIIGDDLGDGNGYAGHEGLWQLEQRQCLGVRRLHWGNGQIRWLGEVLHGGTKGLGQTQPRQPQRQQVKR